ncbi:hypothetical protein PXH66_06865 [Synoicihabitans lomoniglobus]|uniref:Uncharacterized protein n=1 Tax=Synoicihabitans lomoniglobus TaxID=2909285 RepID=A0AAF0I457_9BACT|nr:hypothetical protein PXH66_06865 [Opitutaceae bacterium LMO-M01]
MAAQPSPSDAPASTELVLGMSREDFSATRDLLVEAFEDPEVRALTERIERLMEQRDFLILQKAKETHPGKSAHIDRIGGEMNRHRRGPPPDKRVPNPRGGG